MLCGVVFGFKKWNVKNDFHFFENKNRKQDLKRYEVQSLCSKIWMDSHNE